MLERSPQDEEKRKRFNASAVKWRRFWQGAKPRAAPVPSFAAQAIHLLSISAGVLSLSLTWPSCVFKVLVSRLQSHRLVQQLNSCNDYRLYSQCYVLGSGGMDKAAGQRGQGRHGQRD